MHRQRPAPGDAVHHLPPTHTFTRAHTHAGGRHDRPGGVPPQVPRAAGRAPPPPCPRLGPYARGLVSPARGPCPPLYPPLPGVPPLLAHTDVVNNITNTNTAPPLPSPPPQRERAPAVVPRPAHAAGHAVLPEHRGQGQASRPHPQDGACVVGTTNQDLTHMSHPGPSNHPHASSTHAALPCLTRLRVVWLLCVCALRWTT
jgi:hypothetical protein